MIRSLVEGERALLRPILVVLDMHGTARRCWTVGGTSSWPGTWRCRRSRSGPARLQAFFAHSGAYPWEWLPQYADEWFGDLRSVRRVAHSTMRSYQDALRSFCAYVSDPVYDWP